MLLRMRHEDIKRGTQVVLTEDGAWNLVEILSRRRYKKSGRIYFKVRNLRQIRPHWSGRKDYGDEYTIMMTVGSDDYAGWYAASLDEIRQQPGFKEEWLTPDIPQVQA